METLIYNNLRHHRSPPNKITCENLLCKGLALWNKDTAMKSYHFQLQKYNQSPLNEKNYILK